MIALNVNGKREEVATAAADGDTPLLWVLRDTLGLTGTKFGCGVAACGACTVLVDGQVRRSCAIPLADVAGRHVVTIEGLSSEIADRVKQAWVDRQVPQCGYCQSGMIVAAVALLMRNDQLKDKDIDKEIDQAITNICRCGTYPRIRAAIRAAAVAGRKA